MPDVARRLISKIVSRAIHPAMNGGDPRELV